MEPFDWLLWPDVHFFGNSYSLKMQRVRILNVGHGLCVVIGSFDEVFVFDCGDNRKSKEVPISWKRLVEETAYADQISTIAVSHMHRDHYRGLMEPLPNVRRDVNFVTAAMPKIVGEEKLGKFLHLAALTMATLDPARGPIELELANLIQRSAPEIDPSPKYAGDSLDAAGENWEVLWPPHKLQCDDAGLSKIDKAVKAYELAEDEMPWLKKRRKMMTTSKTYKALVKGMSEPVDEGIRHLEHDPINEIESTDDEDVSVLELPENITSKQRNLLVTADKLLRNAANMLSLVLISDSGVLLTGDATREAMNAALSGRRQRYSVVVTPHHGGEKYIPDAFLNGDLSSQVWATSANKELTCTTNGGYDYFSGIHKNTFESKDICVLVHNGVVVELRTGYKAPSWLPQYFLDEIYFQRFW